ncbi:MAG TPA: helix-turn-helix domain-containing protein [Acidimicrobiia bacterium]
MTVVPPTVAPPSKAKRASAMAPEDRRSMIVAAALPLLLEHGERLTTRQIAEAAGIAEGTIFRAFADKDEVVAAVVDAALDQEPLETAVSAIPTGLPFATAVDAAIAILQERVINVWRIWSSVDTRLQDRARRPIVDSSALTQLFARYRDEITVEPIVAARLLRALTLSTTHPMIAGEPMTASDIVELFLHGVAQCDAQPTGVDREEPC